MCLIIDRNPGVKIPTKMLDTACDINKHGYGLSYIFKDKGGKRRLSMFKRVVEGKDNDPKEIADLLDKHRSVRIFLHLRHATVGDVNVENLHPFFPAVVPDEGVDIGLMHNGTLHEFRPQTGTLSDSHNFTYSLVNPLIKRIVKYSGPDKVLGDPLFQSILLKYVGSMSTLLLFDSFGTVFRINENNGMQHEGWWSSNKYSFDTSHYRSSSRPTYKNRVWCQQTNQFIEEEKAYGDYDYDWGGYGGAYAGRHHIVPEVQTNPQTNIPWDNNSTTKKKAGAWENWEEYLSNVTGKSTKPPDDTRLKYETERFISILTFTQETKDSVMVDGIIQEELEIKRKSFTDTASIKDILEIGRLTIAQLEDMCHAYPKASAQLIVDLLSAASKAKRV